MLWGLVPGHDLGIPFAVALPLEADIIIRTMVHKMSDLEENAYHDTEGGRVTAPDWSWEVCIQ